MGRDWEEIRHERKKVFMIENYKTLMIETEKDTYKWKDKLCF